jgi:hypothetical protein
LNIGLSERIGGYVVVAAGLSVLNNTNRAVPTKGLSRVNNLIEVKSGIAKNFFHQAGDVPLPVDAIAPDLTVS